MSKYIIAPPKTFFLGIDDDSICQIKTSCKEDSYKVYKILLEKFQTRRIWIFHGGKVIENNDN